MRRWYDPSLLHEVTMRTVDGTWWFDPADRDMTAAILGAMADSQAKFPVQIHAFTFMSNHYHAIYSIAEPEQLRSFMGHFHAAVARLVNDRQRRTGPVWARRAHVVPILMEPEAQLRRLRYVLGQGVRAGVATHPRDWAGVSSTHWLLDGTERAGAHVDRTQRALDSRNLTEPLPESDYTRQLAPKLTPLPCFDGVPSDEWRLQINAIADEISLEALGRPELQQGDSPAGGVGKSPPPKKKAAAKVHAGSMASAREYLARRKAFDVAYSDARERQVAAAHRATTSKRVTFVAFPLWAFPAAPPCMAPANLIRAITRSFKE